MPFLLQNDVVRPQKCRRNISEAHEQDVCTLDGRNVQVYVDDMLVKSRKEDNHLDDLRETFETLRSYNMKLNPSKCAFGVTAGKFLRFMVF